MIEWSRLYPDMDPADLSETVMEYMATFPESLPDEIYYLYNYYRLTDEPIDPSIPTVVVGLIGLFPPSNELHPSLNKRFEPEIRQSMQDATVTERVQSFSLERGNIDDAKLREATEAQLLTNQMPSIMAEIGILSSTGKMVISLWLANGISPETGLKQLQSGMGIQAPTQSE